MARRPGLPAFALAFVVALASPAQVPGQEPESASDESAVRAVVLGFKEALVAGDSTAALGYLHPDLVVYEAGHAETLAEYRAAHLAADMEFSAAVETTVLEQGVIVRPGMALWVSESETNGEFRGEPIDSHGVETMILLPTDSGWKILHVHWSSR